MKFLQLAQKRFSTRKFSSKPLEQEKIIKILEVARWAPSACNNQPWIFIVLRDDSSKPKLKSVYNREWFLNAPVIIAACYDRKKSWKRKDGKEFGDIDVALAMDHLTLAAAEEGLGTCWIGSFEFDEAKRVLALPEHIDPVAFTPLGYPQDSVTGKMRKDMQEIVFWEKFSR